MRGDSRGRPADDGGPVREITHHQFTYGAGNGATPGSFNLRLVLDEGAAEKVINLLAQDVTVVSTLLGSSSTAHYDLSRREMTFDMRRVGGS